MLRYIIGVCCNLINHNWKRRFYMAKKDDVYKCDVCKQVIFVSVGGEGELTCCGQKMRLLHPDQIQMYEKRMAKPGSP